MKVLSTLHVCLQVDKEKVATIIAKALKKQEGDQLDSASSAGDRDGGPRPTSAGSGGNISSSYPPHVTSSASDMGDSLPGGVHGKTETSRD